jgi:hypothetical protein
LSNPGSAPPDRRSEGWRKRQPSSRFGAPPLRAAPDLRLQRPRRLPP